AHPSDNLGATLSVAESLGASGKDLLLSTVLAYELQCRLCDAADIRHRGWDHVCYGLVSVALAAARLMGLGPAKMTEAVNIALNAHIAMRQVRAGELSMWKGSSFSNAARNAVFAASLAKDPEKWRTTTKETADHSLPYIVGMALLEGKIENSTYAPTKFRNKKTLDFLKKITVKEDKRLTALYPNEGIANRITVRTKSG